jgi:hypothetical protein
MTKGTYLRHENTEHNRDSETRSLLVTRLATVKEIVEGSSKTSAGDHDHKGLPGIWKANFLRLKLTEESTKGGFE